MGPATLPAGAGGVVCRTLRRKGQATRASPRLQQQGPNRAGLQRRRGVIVVIRSSNARDELPGTSSQQTKHIGASTAWRKIAAGLLLVPAGVALWLAPARPAIAAPPKPTTRVVDNGPAATIMPWVTDAVSRGQSVVAQAVAKPNNYVMGLSAAMVLLLTMAAALKKMDSLEEEIEEEQETRAEQVVAAGTAFGSSSGLFLASSMAAAERPSVESILGRTPVPRIATSPRVLTAGAGVAAATALAATGSATGGAIGGPWQAPDGMQPSDPSEKADPTRKGEEGSVRPAAGAKASKEVATAASRLTAPGARTVGMVGSAASAVAAQGEGTSNMHAVVDLESAGVGGTQQLRLQGGDRQAAAQFAERFMPDISGEAGSEQPGTTFVRANPSAAAASVDSNSAATGNVGAATASLGGSGAVERPVPSDGAATGNTSTNVAKGRASAVSTWTALAEAQQTSSKAKQLEDGVTADSIATGATPEGASQPAGGEAGAPGSQFAEVAATDVVPAVASEAGEGEAGSVEDQGKGWLFGGLKFWQVGTVSGSGASVAAGDGSVDKAATPSLAMAATAEEVTAAADAEQSIAATDANTTSLPEPGTRPGTTRVRVGATMPTSATVEEGVRVSVRTHGANAFPAAVRETLASMGLRPLMDGSLARVRSQYDVMQDFLALEAPTIRSKYDPWTYIRIAGPPGAAADKRDDLVKLLLTIEVPESGDMPAPLDVVGQLLAAQPPTGSSKLDLVKSLAGAEPPRVRSRWDWLSALLSVQPHSEQAGLESPGAADSTMLTDVNTALGGPAGEVRQRAKQAAQATTAAPLVMSLGSAQNKSGGMVNLYGVVYEKSASEGQVKAVKLRGVEGE